LVSHIGVKSLCGAEGEVKGGEEE